MVHASSRRPASARTACVRTSWGAIKVEIVGGRVVDCALPRLDQEPTAPFRMIGSEGDAAAVRFVEAVFSGRKTKVPPVAPAGTAFKQAVWQAIAAIPAGQTRTYGELAAAIGRPRAVRAVGGACGRNPVPLFIPCHRVVAANGGEGGFSSGLPWKRLLLAIEALRPHRA